MRDGTPRIVRECVKRGAGNRNLINGLVYPVAGRESPSFSLGEVSMWIESRAEHYRDLSVAASRQLASQPKLENTLCKWRGRRIH
jgi:hypothetical protein